MGVCDISENGIISAAVNERTGLGNRDISNGTANSTFSTLLSTDAFIEKYRSLDEDARRRIYDEMDSYNSVPEVVAEPTKRDLTAIDKVAEKLTGDQALVKAAYDGINNVREHVEDLHSIVSGTSVGHKGFWANFKNVLMTTFADANSNLHLFFSTIKDVPGTNTWNNPITQWYNNAFVGVKQHQDYFSTRNAALMRQYRDKAENAGLTLDELMTLGGHYHAALHAVEANETLRARMQQAYDDKLSEFRGKDLSDSELEKYQDELETLRDDLDRFDRNQEVTHGNINDEDRDKLKTSGMTNAEAERVRRDVMSKTGMTESELNYLAQQLAEEFHHVHEVRAKNGTFDPTAAEKFRDYKYYAPLRSHADNSGSGNIGGSPGDTWMYTMGDYYERGQSTGVNHEMDSSWITLQAYQKRASVEMGTHEFGMSFNRVWDDLVKQGVVDAENKNSQIPLRRYVYDEIRGMTYNPDSGTQANADRLLRQGGLVTMEWNPETSKFEKYLYVFDNTKFEFNGSKFDGRDLNQALTFSYHYADTLGPVRALGKGASWMGSMYTRFTPGFAPTAALRDVTERMFNSMNRQYVMPDGSILEGYRVAPHLMANLVQSGALFLRGMRDALDPVSEEGQIYREYNEMGVGSRMTQRTEIPQNMSFDDYLKTLDGKNRLANIGIDSPEYRKWLVSAGNRAGDVLNVVDKWNDYFQNLAAFNQYRTLRKMGVGVDEAAAKVRGEMNLYVRGKIAPYMSAMAPFHAPSVQSGVALLRSFGLGADKISDIPKEGWKGAAALLASYVGYSMLMDVARDSMGEDENGASLFDALTFDEKTRFLPVGLGDGTYVKLPIGFGGPQLGAAMAVAMDEVGRGHMDMPELVAQTVYLALKTNAPGGWSEDLPTDKPLESLMYLFTPQVFKPVYEAMTNMNFMGNPIYSDPWTPETPRSAMGYTSTPRFYNKLSAELQDICGIDYQPEVYQHLFRQYMIGPFRIIPALARSADDLYAGSERQSIGNSMPPVLAAAGLGMYVGSVMSPSRNIYMATKSRMDERVRRERLGLTGSLDDRVEQLRAAGWSEDDVNDYVVVHQADNELRKLGTNFTSSFKKDWLAMDSSQKMYDAFREYGDAKDYVYINAVKALREYQ